MEGPLLHRPSTVTLQALYDMYMRDVLTDVTLIAYDHRTVTAHASLLSAASPVIRNMLQNHPHTTPATAAAPPTSVAATSSLTAAATAATTSPTITHLSSQPEQGKSKTNTRIKFEGIPYEVLKHYVDSLYVEYQHTSIELLADFLQLCKVLRDDFMTEAIKKTPAYASAAPEKSTKDCREINVYVDTSYSNAQPEANNSVVVDTVDVGVIEQNVVYEEGVEYQEVVEGMEYQEVEDGDDDYIVSIQPLRHTDQDAPQVTEQLPLMKCSPQNQVIVKVCGSCSKVLCPHRKQPLSIEELEYSIQNDEGIILSQGASPSHILRWKSSDTSVTDLYFCISCNLYLVDVKNCRIHDDAKETQESREMNTESMDHSLDIKETEGNETVSDRNLLHDNVEADSFWKCEKCNKVICTHRQQKMSPAELDFVTSTEGIVVQDKKQPLSEQNLKNLNSQQKQIAEQYQDILCMPCKILTDPELGMKKIVYPCPHCEFLLLGFASVLHHLSFHNVELPELKCSLCPVSFSSKSQLRKHDMRKHGGKHRLGETGGGHCCSQCGISYSSEGALQRHVENHSNDLQEVKDLLEMKHTFTRRYNPDTKSFTRSYACSVCSASFPQQQRLETHLTSQHGIRPYACSECSATFGSESGLEKHGREHSGVRPFICSKCGAGFSRLESLHAHRRSVHASGLQHQCEVCDKRYKTNSSLVEHIKRVHGKFALPDGEKSDYQCCQCGKFLPTERVYKVHIRHHKHDGKPLKCRKCPETFKYHSARLRHEKAVHADGGTNG